MCLGRSDKYKMGVQTLDDPKTAQQTIVVNEETLERHHRDFPELFELGPEDPNTLLKAMVAILFHQNFSQVDYSVIPKLYK